MASQIPRLPADVLRLFEGVSSASASGDRRAMGFNINTIYARGIHPVVPGARSIGPAVTLRYLPARDDFAGRERERLAAGESIVGSYPPSEEVLRQFRERPAPTDPAGRR